MISFTALSAGFILFALLILFGLTYKFKGLKTAFIATSVALVVSVIVFAAAIYAIVRVIPN